MANQDVVQQVQVAWDLNENELYEHLGMASLGAENMHESLQSMTTLKSLAANTDAGFATESLSDTLLQKGRQFFEASWADLKGIVCTVYTDKLNIGDKDLATYLVGVIVAAGLGSNPLVVLVVTVAVKKGLANMCPIKST